MAIETPEEVKVRSWAKLAGLRNVPPRPIRESIFSLTTNPPEVERTFDLGAGVTVVHCKYELPEGDPGKMPRTAQVVEVDFSPNLEGFPDIGAPYYLEAVQQMGKIVMANFARNIRNVDLEGNIILPILRYNQDGIAYKDYAVLPAPNILLFRTHRAMVFRIKSILEELVEQQVIGKYITEIYDEAQCPALADVIYKYAHKSDVRVTRALTKRVYVIYAPIIPFNPDTDKEQIIDTTRSLDSQFLFALGKHPHGKEI